MNVKKRAEPEKKLVKKMKQNEWRAQDEFRETSTKKIIIFFLSSRNFIIIFCPPLFKLESSLKSEAFLSLAREENLKCFWMKWKIVDEGRKSGRNVGKNWNDLWTRINSIMSPQTTSQLHFFSVQNEFSSQFTALLNTHSKIII